MNALGVIGMNAIMTRPNKFMIPLVRTSILRLLNGQELFTTDNIYIEGAKFGGDISPKI
jgi:hypothetical protein